MELYREYPAWLIFLISTCAVAASILALPFMLFWKDRARFYSYLHRVCRKPAINRCGWIRPKRQPVIFTDCQT